MLIEIHMLQNHAPSNLNRDDTGSPKDCVFGGVRRARISSQCLKRSIRRSSLFTEGLDGAALAVRTRHLPQQVKEALLARGVSSEMAEIAASKASGFGNKEGKEAKDGKTAQIMFLSPQDITAVADALHEAINEAGTAAKLRDMKAKDIQARAVLKGWRPITPDIALFGRMITSEAFRDVEAAMQVAHAISTNRMDHEFDYYTAVDDLQGVADEDEAGAGMIGDVEFNSATYYKYFSVDLNALIDNLAGDDRTESHLEEARRLAVLTVVAFVRAAVFTTPTGKQNTFAAHQLPDGLLVEVRPEQIPVSYANAFLKPVRPQADDDLMDASLKAFADHVSSLTRRFSLKADARLWFSTRETNISGAVVCSTLDDLIGRLTATMGGGRVANG